MKNQNFFENLNFLKEEIYQLKEEVSKAKTAEKILDKISNYLLVIDPQERILYSNSSAREVFEINDIDNNYTNLLNGEKDVLSAKSFISQVYQNGKTLKSVHLMYKNLSNSNVVYLTNFFPLENGEKERKIVVEIYESDSGFRALAENSKDVIMRFDKNHKHLYVNPAVSNTIDMTPQEMIGKTHAELNMPEDLVELWEGLIDKVFETGKEIRTEFELPTGGVWIDWLLMPEKDPEGNVKYVITSARDITELKSYQNRINKHAENLQRKVKEATNDLIARNKKLFDTIKEKNELLKKLSESEKLYSTIINSAMDSILLIDPNANIFFCNEAAVELFGFKSKKELLGAYVFSLLHPDDMNRARADFERFLTEKKNIHTEYKLVKKSGETFYAEISASLNSDDYSQPVHIVAIIRDITEKQKHHEEIELREKKYRELFEFSAIGAMILEPDGTIADVNNRACDIYKFRKGNLIGKNLRDVNIVTKLSNIEENINKILNGNILTHTVKNLRNDGKYIYVELHEKLIVESDGSKKIFLTINDITEKVANEKSMIEKEFLYRFIFDNSPSGMIILNGNGIILQTNSAFAEQAGYEPKDILNQNINDFIHTGSGAADYHDVIKAVTGGDNIVQEVNFMLKEGNYKTFEFNAVRVPLTKEDYGVMIISKQCT